MVNYYPAALGIAVMTLQHHAPMINTYNAGSNPAEQTDSITVTAETKRDVLTEEIMEGAGTIHGQSWELIAINAPALAQVLDVSTETARRRLEYFEDQGILQLWMEGRPNYYHMKGQFTAEHDDTVRPESEIISTTKKFIESAEEE